VVPLNFNVYIDGTWLYNQCLPERILANRMEFPDKTFELDFGRLLEAFCVELGDRVRAEGGEPPTVGSLYFYTAIFDIPDEPDPEWPDVSSLRRSVAARQRFADKAVAADFSPDGIYRVPLRTWIIEELRERRYQEKMVDTSLVARLVEQTIADPQRLHLVVTGDTDIVPAIQTVVPDYADTVVLACTHPDQYNPGEAQSSFRLAQFPFRYEPIYLEQLIERIAAGDNVYQCSNPRCNSFFVRERPVPSAANPVCHPCWVAKEAQSGRRT
jgi:hypothetical protein